MIHAVRAALSRAKASIQRVSNSRHRAFHAQRQVLDRAERERRAERLASTRPHSGEAPPTAVTALRTDGYVRLRPLLSLDQIAAVRAHFADRLAFDLKRREWGKFIAPYGVPGGCRGAEYSHDDVLAAPHLLRAANDPALLRLVEGYLGAMPIIAALRVWWTLPVPGTEPEDTELFHRDMDDYRFLKLFVYLTEVDGDAGPHVFVAGSHRTAVLNEIRRYTEDEVGAAMGSAALLRFTGPAGTAFLEATYGLHRATPPVARPRLAFQVLYTLRPTLYGPRRPLRARSLQERDLSAYVNQVYLRD